MKRLIYKLDLRHENTADVIRRIQIWHGNSPDTK